MAEVYGGVVINTVEAEPLSDYVIGYLTAQKRETPYLDFKLTIHVGKGSDFPEIAKDIFAFSNYGGGWILIGWKRQKNGEHIPVGVPDDYDVDQAVLQEKFNSYSNEKIELDYAEFQLDGKKVAALYIPPFHKILKPIKEGKYKRGRKERRVFKKDEIFYRRGTQSIRSLSNYELELLNKRLKKENYRLSVLSGNPDEIEESIYSNLFPVTALPKYVYRGIQKGYDDVSIKVLLKQEGVFPHFFHKFKQWGGEIVTFENLEWESNIYRKLMQTDTITKEPIEDWIKDPDKNRIIIELLNRELKHYAISKGMFHFKEKNRLYYALDTHESPKRTEKWRARYETAKRTVAAQMFAEQLKRFIYCHTAFSPSFIEIGPGKFYLKILPTFVLTDDGRNPIFGFKEGTVITRLSYGRHNNQYLNTILFWIHQLGDGKNIEIGDYLVIGSKPIEAEVPVGIIFDIPSSEFRLQIGEEIKEDENTNDEL